MSGKFKQIALTTGGMLLTVALYGGTMFLVYQIGREDGRREVWKLQAVERTKQLASPQEVATALRTTSGWTVTLKPGTALLGRYREMNEADAALEAVISQREDRRR